MNNIGNLSTDFIRKIHSLLRFGSGSSSPFFLNLKTLCMEWICVLNLSEERRAPDLFLFYCSLVKSKTDDINSEPSFGSGTFITHLGWLFYVRCNWHKIEIGDETTAVRDLQFWPELWFVKKLNEVAYSGLMRMVPGSGLAINHFMAQTPPTMMVKSPISAQTDTHWDSCLEIYFRVLLII